MHKLINPKYIEISDIYSKEKPNFLLPFFESETIKRLSDISQNCGTEYCNLFDYDFSISRLDHSLGVALIIWNFTKDKKQTLSGFFHDISHSVFSHVGDYLIGDIMNQESSEKHTTWLLKNDKIIKNELLKLNINIDEIDNYEIFPVADNNLPGLAADRLEYNLISSLMLKTKNIEDIKKIYDDIIILKNEKGFDELGFKNIEFAEKLGLLSIENDKNCYSSHMSKISMSFLSEIIKEVLNNNIIREFDLYKLKEQEIINIIKNCDNKKIQKMWKFFENLGEYKIHNSKPNTNNFYTSSLAKKRYIDPLIKTKHGNIRLSKLSNIFVSKRDELLNKKEEWIEIDFII